MDPPLCINDILPTEIMQNIFQRLESKDLFQSMNACKYWQDVIMEHNEVDLHVGRRNRHIWSDYDGYPFAPIEVMKKFRTRRAFISKLENKKVELQPLQTEFWRKPDLLRYLWIDGHLRSGTLSNMLIGLSNLEKLEIHFNTLTTLHPGDISSGSFQSLVNLKDFSIRIFSRELNGYKHRLNGFTNAARIFIAVKFPNLECFNLSLPSQPRFEEHFSALLQFITYFMIQHESTLKSFKLFIGNYGGGGELFFCIAFPPETDTPPVTGQDLKALKMKSIEIHSFQPSIPLSDWMLEFVNGQRNLEVIHLTVRYLSVEQIQQLVPNYSIKVIQLTVDTLTQPLDLNLFSTCTQLKKLELKGICRDNGIVDYQEEERIQAEDVDLIGGSLISKTLEVLILIHLHISTQDITEILQYQMNLKILRCYYIGMVENFGVSVDTFMRLVSERNVEKIFLRNSINLENVVMDGFQPNEIGGLNIESILNHKNNKNENEISLRLDGENYSQIEEEEYGQVFPDGRNFPNFMIYEHEYGRPIRDEFHETPPGFNGMHGPNIPGEEDSDG